MLPRIVIILMFLMGLAPQTTMAADGESILDCPSRPTNKGKARRLAGALFSDATRAFDENRFSEALKLFLCSMRIIEHQNTLINVEKAAQEIENKRDALPLLKAYADEMPDRELTPDITRLITAMEDDLAEEKEKAEAAEVSATPDDKIFEEPPPAEPEPQEEEEPPVKDASRLLEISGWTNVGLGAGTFVAAVVFQGFAAASRTRAGEASTYDAFLDEKEKSRAFQVGATSTFVASALFAGMGIAQLVLLKETDRSGDDALHVTITPRFAWIGVKGVF